MAMEKQIALPGKLREVVVTDSAVPVGPPAAAVFSRTAQTLADEAQDVAEREQVERILASLRDAAGSLRTRQAEYLHAMQRLTMELAVAIASRLLHEQIETGSFPIETLVRQVTQRLEAKQPMAVHLHPADLALLKKRAGGSLFPTNVDVEFIADANMARGDCKAQAGDVTVLANLEEQLADIRQRLLESVPAFPGTKQHEAA